MSFKRFVYLGMLIMPCLSGFISCHYSNVRHMNTKIESTLKTDIDEYNYPEYIIGFFTFANETPSKMLGIGESATIIIRKMILNGRLTPVLLSKKEKIYIETTIINNKSGNIEPVAEWSEAPLTIDFLLAGSVKAYSEINYEPDNLIIQNRTKASIAEIDINLIDVITGDTIVQKSFRGEYVKKSKDKPEFSVNNRTDLIKGALEDCLYKAFEDILSRLKKMPFRGEMQTAEERTVLFKGGKRSRLEIGSRLAVYRRNNAALNTKTLKENEEKIGEIILASHRDNNISVGRIISGKGFKRGDMVRLIRY